MGRLRVIPDQIIRLGSGGLQAFNAPAYTWYVDSITGSDSNNGKAAGAAFATIEKLLTVMQAGDVVGLAKGSTWREQLTIPGNACTIAAYGTGSAPILNASNIAAKASISKTGGQTNVYEISVTPDWAASKSYLNVWEDGAFLVRASSLANCDATAGSYFPSASTGTITLYIHASDNSDVSANAKVYEYSQRQFGLDAYNYTGVIVDGVETRNQLHEDGSLRLGIGGIARNCTFRNGNKHCVLFRDGTSLTDCAAINSYYGASSAQMFVANENAPAGLGVTLTRCTAQLTTYDANVGGFYSHSNVSGSFGTITYNACVGTNLATGISGTGGTAAAGLIVANDCTFTGCMLGYTPVNDMQINRGSFTSPHASYRAINVGANGITVTIDGMTITSSIVPSGGVVYSSNAFTLTMRNCTITGCVNEFIFALSGVVALTLDHNYYNNVYGVLQVTNAGSTISSDYNRFWREAIAQNYLGTSYATIALYRAGTGQDAHSTVG